MSLLMAEVGGIRVLKSLNELAIEFGRIILFLELIEGTMR